VIQTGPCQTESIQKTIDFDTDMLQKLQESSIYMQSNQEHSMLDDDGDGDD